MNAIDALHHAYKLFPDMADADYADVAADLCTGRLDVHERYGAMCIHELNALTGLTHIFFLSAHYSERLRTVDLSATHIKLLYITVRDYGDAIVPLLPATLKELRVAGAGRVVFTGPLPAGLSYLGLCDIQGGIQNLPTLPMGLRSLVLSPHLMDDTLPVIPTGCKLYRCN